MKKYDVGSIADGLFEQVMQNTMQYLQLYGGNIKNLSPKTQDTFEKSLDLLQKSLSETVRKVDEEFNNYRKPFLDICIKFVQDPSHPYGMTKFAFLTLGVLLRYTQVMQNWTSLKCFFFRRNGDRNCIKLCPLVERQFGWTQ